MSGPFGSAQLMYNPGFYPELIDQSLRFDGTSYLSRTFGSGNRKTYTFSSWAKRSSLTGTQVLLCPGDGSTFGDIGFNSASSIQANSRVGSTNYFLVTSQVFRDTSAWYHITWAIDTTQATAANRVKLYVNGVQVTAFSTEQYPPLNADTNLNNAIVHWIGKFWEAGYEAPFNGYLADTYFVDGQALDATSFGEFKSGVWIPKAYTGSYGTNGFHLTYQDDTVSEGFNTVTYTGDGATTQNVTGVGFQPDFTWIKERSSTSGHVLADSVRGYDKYLVSNETIAESTGVLNSVLSDGFRTTNSGATNQSGQTYVAWNWDAGSSTVSNTDGSITSSVRANPAYGFSIVSYTGNGTAGATIGHGLSATPSVLIVKPRSIVDNWNVYHASNTAQPETDVLYLNLSNSTSDNNTIWNDTAPTASVFSIGSNSGINTNASPYIAYCFSEIAGYSKFGSYTANTTTPPAITGLGFEPAFLMVKNTARTEDWAIVDNTRDVGAPKTKYLAPNNSSAEINSVDRVTFNSDGFTVNAPASYTFNFQTGDTYIYMAFADTRDLAFWRDQSGNGNDWQPTNLNYQDTVFDSPTNNYATINPLDNFYNGGTLSNGNLQIVTGSSQYSYIRGTFGVASGKWYFEATAFATSSANSWWDIGWSGGFPTATTSGLGNAADELGYIGQNGVYRINSAETSSGTTYGLNDVIGVMIDLDNNLAYFSVNGTIINSGTGFSIPAVSATRSGFYYPAFGDFDSVGTKTWQANFGQSGFTYTPPAGFLALSTANLPEPSISPLYGASPQDHFNTVLYTGNGSTQGITGVGFQPDWLWVKRRSTAAASFLFDCVRGASNRVRSDTTEAESSGTPLTSFDSDGFTLGDNSGNSNASGSTYAAWNWKASNATAVSNTAGSITSQVSANTTAGFSIVSYTGTGSAATVGHGLGVAPEMMIIKVRSTTNHWVVYHQSLGNTKAIYLSLTGAADTNASFWNNTSPTSSVFTINTDTISNANTATYIAYCFNSVEGYSKFGSYTGNGSSDGPFVYTGFRPAWVMVKSTANAGTNWTLYDDKRPDYNLVDKSLFPNVSDAEVTAAWAIDILSNGFKLRGSGGYINTASSPYIYMAFAENPFKYANAR